MKKICTNTKTKKEVCRRLFRLKNKHVYFFLFLLLFAFCKDANAQTCVTNPGATWTVPAGVTTATVYCWGGGGGGGGSQTGAEFANGGGGGGGACAISVLTVVAGQVYTITQGAGGAGGNNSGGNGGSGGTTTFTGAGGTVSAAGGSGGIGSIGSGGANAGGAGGSTGTGTTIYSGAHGSSGNDGTSSTTGITGTGGGGAGSGSSATNPPSTCAATGTGGTGTYAGGTGGVNPDCNTTNDLAGVAGSAAGGGGSGANSWTQSLTGGVGGAGQVVICYNGATSSGPTCVTNPGATWTVPAGITTATVYCWGGGGGGGGSTTGAEFANGGGGGGGACAISVLTVVAGQVYSITTGAGGTAGNTSGGNGGNGGSTTVTGAGGTVVANGGAGGTGSIGSGGANAGGAGGSTGTGTTIYSGGNGSAGNDGTSSTTGITGTGGGGAGSGGNGTNPPSTCAATGTGGTGTYTGGAGGDDPDCGTTNNSAGVAGSSPGGGGSGANCWTGSYTGGAGGAGQVVICYDNSAPVATSSCVTNPGASWTVPSGVTSATVQCWGGGGGSGGSNNASGGNGQAAGGGGGGACAISVLTVSSGQVYTITQGAGGTAGTSGGGNGGNGGTTTVTGAGGTVVANGGGGGGGSSNGTAGTAGAGATTGTGTTINNGGNGTVGVRNSSLEVGGAGGGGGGTTSAGANGTAGTTGGANSTGGAGGTGTYAGGAGAGATNSTGTLPGVAGNAPGGGAAGSCSYGSNAAGAVGGAGQVVICYNTCSSPTITTAAAPTTQTICQNATPTNITLSASGTSLTYQWYSNTLNLTIGGTSVGAGNGGQTNTYTPPTTAAGTLYYYCIVSGACAPTATSTAVKVVVTASPTVAAIAGGASTVCVGNPSPAFTDATAGGTWSITNGTGSAATSTVGVVTGISVGTVTLSYAVTSSGCTTTVTDALTVSDVLFVAAIGGGAPTVCVGNSTPAFTDATAGGTWSIINGTGSATITAGGVLTGVSAGLVTVNYAVTNVCGTVNVTYAVTITTGCSGIPTAGTAIASQSSGCGSVYTSTISLTGSTVGCGISYQWYSSTNGTTWTAIGGATSSSYPATVSANTYYECILTCSNGGATGTSSSVYCSYSIANDVCASATALTFAPGINLGDYIATIVGNNTCATADGTSQCFSANKSVWYTFTAPAAGSYNAIIQCGTMKYPEISMRTGTCASVTEKSCAGRDNSGTIWDSDDKQPVNGYSPFSLYTKYYAEAGICNLTAGQTAYIMVDDYETAGTFTLTVATLTNDAIPNGVVVANCGSVFNSSTIGATNCGDCTGAGYNNNLDCNTATDCNGSNGASCGDGYISGGYLYGTGTAGNYTNPYEQVSGGDVGYSVENDSWYQFCVTTTATVSVAFAPVASSCLPSASQGGSNGLQMAIFTGTSANLTKVDGGFTGMDVTGTFNSTYVMTANQCSYIEVDGFAGTNCNYNLTVNMTPTCVLPVEMLYFKSILTDDIRVKLDWASATEENADHYVIERSLDGIDYTEIGTMQAKGNGYSQASYTLYDNSPAKGLNYYKLSGADKNGKETFLGYTAISNNASLPVFSLYPNPAQNNITLSLKNFSTPTIDYELYSAQGVLLKTETINLVDGNQNYKIDLSQLNAGFYFIKIDTGSELLKKTFIKSE
jgi:hypothetical protein